MDREQQKTLHIVCASAPAWYGNSITVEATVLHYLRCGFSLRSSLVLIGFFPKHIAQITGQS